MAYRITTQQFEMAVEGKTESEALDAFARQTGYASYQELADTIGKTVDDAKADLTIAPMTSAEVFRSGANRMMPALDALLMAQSILAVRTLLGPITLKVAEISRAIARVDREGIVATDCDLGALNAVEALYARLNEAGKALDACADLFSAGRDESGVQLVARLNDAAFPV